MKDTFDRLALFMCLIALAHRASERFPLVLAANRDEDFQRPTHDAHFWAEAPNVVGGRDALQGGSWLAVSAGGRFAAVTNLRGAAPRARSRGALVSDFVRGAVGVHEYATEVARHANEYSGFHLLAGTIGGDVLYIAPETQHELSFGASSLSNAPRDETWPKTALAESSMNEALALNDETAMLDHLMRFLTTPRGTEDPRSEVFIDGERYGTRASTVVIATAEEILFVERTRSGRKVFRMRRTVPSPRDERGEG